MTSTLLHLSTQTLEQVAGDIRKCSFFNHCNVGKNNFVYIFDQFFLESNKKSKTVSWENLHFWIKIYCIEIFAVTGNLKTVFK